MKSALYKSIVNNRKIISGTAILFLAVVLMDVFIRMTRTKSIVKSCDLVFGPLDPEQKESIALIVRAFDRYGDKDLNKLAYILATAKHESNFRAIEEYRSNTDRQNAYWHTGFYGRGFVQFTHEKNYRKMSDFLRVNLVQNPSLALDPNNAAKILVYGMMNGRFTRKPLHYYINSSMIDFYNARKTVNGLDRAERIALYAQSIHNQLI